MIINNTDYDLEFKRLAMYIDYYASLHSLNSLTSIHNQSVMHIKWI